jgi:hypothetical protein
MEGVEKNAKTIKPTTQWIAGAIAAWVVLLTRLIVVTPSLSVQKDAEKQCFG